MVAAIKITAHTGAAVGVIALIIMLLWSFIFFDELNLNCDYDVFCRPNRDLIRCCSLR